MQKRQREIYGFLDWIFVTFLILAILALFSFVVSLAIHQIRLGNIERAEKELDMEWCYENGYTKMRIVNGNHWCVEQGKDPLRVNRDK